MEIFVIGFKSYDGEIKTLELEASSINEALSLAQTILPASVIISITRITN